MHRFQRARLGSLDEWCPEYKLCSAEVDMKPRPAAAPPAKPAAAAAAPAVQVQKVAPVGVPAAKAVGA